MQRSNRSITPEREGSRWRQTKGPVWWRSGCSNVWRLNEAAIWHDWSQKTPRCKFLTLIFVAAVQRIILTCKLQRAAPPGRCHSCNRIDTPEWRRGPDGARTLCNACGLHYAKLERKRQLEARSLRPKPEERSWGGSSSSSSRGLDKMLYVFQLPKPSHDGFVLCSSVWRSLWSGEHADDTQKKKTKTFFIFFTKHFLQNKIPIFLPKACMESFYCTCVFEHGILGLGGK